MFLCCNFVAFTTPSLFSFTSIITHPPTTLSTPRHHLPPACVFRSLFHSRKRAHRHYEQRRRQRQQRLTPPPLQFTALQLEVIEIWQSTVTADAATVIARYRKSAREAFRPALSEPRKVSELPPKERPTFFMALDLPDNHTQVGPKLLFFWGGILRLCRGVRGTMLRCPVFRVLWPSRPPFFAVVGLGYMGGWGLG